MRSLNQDSHPNTDSLYALNFIQESVEGETIPLERRIEVTRGFYRKYMWRYPDAAYDSWMNLRKGLIKDQPK